MLSSRATDLLGQVETGMTKVKTHIDSIGFASLSLGGRAASARVEGSAVRRYRHAAGNKRRSFDSPAEAAGSLRMTDQWLPLADDLNLETGNWKLETRNSKLKTNYDPLSSRAAPPQRPHRQCSCAWYRCAPRPARRPAAMPNACDRADRGQ